ncbi:MAG: response regulator transcription factor [Rhodoferax sp.]|uniref:response regulator transcription factor n=1 Tax=Rhodoferax sp. TaxID=50421 RepID=UPI001B40A791|nr:response regulator [Rhodoferax sp.]MBP9905118.1 response regulator transcription factor [Rhodoferax sp.]
MRHDGLTVFVVEDDPSVRDALGLLLGLRGFPVALFRDAESFLEVYQPDWAGCLLLDIRMPGMDGLSLQAQLQSMGCQMPIIIMTGHGDMASARRAFRAHALDFLEKPLDHGLLMERIDEAMQSQADPRKVPASPGSLGNRIAALTPRERQVMDLVVAGNHNREIAVELGISVRTVEVHKARMMDKLRVDGLSQLIRMVISAESDG